MKKAVCIMICLWLLAGCALAEGRGTYVVTHNVNERTGPGTEYDIVVLRTVGETLNVREIKDGWARLKNGHWVIAKNISAEDSEKSGECYRNLEMFVSVTSANVRSGPGKSYDVLEQKDFGTRVRVKERDGDWCRISGGYIHESCLAANLENHCLDANNDVILISKKDQTVKQYSGGKLQCEVKCVTGGPDSPTPSGVYRVGKVASNVDMLGSEVKTALYFNGNIALHDASWRSSFGGTRYLRNGSHGCVNVSEEAIDIISETARKGTTVVVYE